jgi:hypothetical protein
MGMAFASGHGVQQDAVQATQWIAKAAAQGHPEAQFLLALAYRDGVGVERDISAARYWLKLAAATGHAGATKAAQQLETT